jgi:phosphosulfolactate phosphohydrolase-like enzyme
MILSKFRTHIIGALGILALVGGSRLCISWPNGVAIFDALKDGVVMVVAYVAGRSAVEHLAQGNGVKGAWATLTTSSKPTDETK